MTVQLLLEEHCMRLITKMLLWLRILEGLLTVVRLGAIARILFCRYSYSCTRYSESCMTWSLRDWMLEISSSEISVPIEIWTASLSSCSVSSSRIELNSLWTQFVLIPTAAKTVNTYHMQKYILSSGDPHTENSCLKMRTQVDSWMFNHRQSLNTHVEQSFTEILQKGHKTNLCPDLRHRLQEAGLHILLHGVAFPAQITKNFWTQFAFICCISNFLLYRRQWIFLHNIFVLADSAAENFSLIQIAWDFAASTKKNVDCSITKNVHAYALFQNCWIDNRIFHSMQKLCKSETVQRESGTRTMSIMTARVPVNMICLACACAWKIGCAAGWSTDPSSWRPLNIAHCLLQSFPFPGSANRTTRARA